VLLAGIERGAQDVQLQQAQLAVGDDEEVAAAAGRVEEGEAGDLLVQLEELLRAAPGGLESARSSSRNSGLMSLRMLASEV
jgi:hypothetical protein